MEIQVGEYVRTNQGYIAKLEDIDKEFMYFDNVIMCYYEETKLLPINVEMLDGIFLKAEDYVVKHSFNIIDLIEIEDLVNVIDGDTTAVCEVIGTGIRDKNFKKTNEIGVRYMSDEMDIIPLKRIKSVLTKEQFKAMKYEVK